MIFVLGLLILFFVLLHLVDNDIAQTSLEAVMRVTNCFIMAVLGVYLPELFSADNRGRGTNFVMSFGVLGGGLAPLMLESLPWWGLLGFILMSIGSAMLLPETYNGGRLKELGCQGKG